MFLARGLRAPAAAPLGAGDAGAALLLLLLVGAVFGQVAGHAFVEWDDPDYVTRHPLVLQGLSWAGAREVWTLIHASNWHPLTWLSHMLDVSLWGTWAGGHHLTSVVLHGVATVLFYLFLAGCTGARGRSLLAAALFAIHPLHVESVAWVAERKDVLSATLWFATLVLYARYARQPGTGRYLATLAAFAAGLSAKPMLVSLPLIMLLMDVWPMQRLGASPRWPELRRQAPALVREKIPFFALALASSLITLQAQRSALVPVADLPLDERLALAVWASAKYLWQTAWPTNLSFFYPRQPLAVADLAAAGATLAIAGLLGVLAWRTYPLRAGAVGLLWYLIALLPVIGVIKVGPQAHADRYTYLPLAGVFIALCWGIRWPARPRLLLPGALALIGGLGLLAWQQTRVWHSGDRLFAHALRINPGNQIALVQWGHTRLRAGDPAGAAELAARALAASQDTDTRMQAHQLLGHAAMARNDLPRAIAEYRASAAAGSQSALLHYNLGTALLLADDLAGARHALETAARLQPNYSAAHTNLGVVYLRLGDEAAALAAYRAAIAADAANLEARYNLARRLAVRGELDAARQQLEEILRRRPDHPGGGALLRELGG